MHTAYNYSEAFAPAREQFEKLVIQLQRMLSADHGQIETCIRTGGFELLRRLFQGHLDLRAICEEPLVDVTGSDAVARTHIRTGCKRNLMTLFGQVKVRRIGYSARSVTSLFPMDAQLNLPVDKQSHGVRKQLAEEVLAKSFDQSVLRLADTSGAKVAKLQAEQLTAKLSEDFGTFYEQQNDGAEQTDDILIMTIDGKGIVMNEKSLRECTQKAAKTEKHKMKTRLSKGEKRNRKRMATVASVYSVAEHKRIPEAIMGSEDEQPGAVRPRAKNKRVWASVERDPKDVAEEMVTAPASEPEPVRIGVPEALAPPTVPNGLASEPSTSRVPPLTVVEPV